LPKAVNRLPNRDSNFIEHGCSSLLEDVEMSKKFMRVSVLLVAFLALLATVQARAQFNASVSGTVFDSTQAAIPGATVTLTNTATQATQTVQSGSSGIFQFSELGPGTYNVTVVAKGFQQNVVSNVAIAAETPRTLNVTLQTGQETQTVNVDADTEPTLQNSDASIGSTITSEEINRLPIFGADPYELLRTAPGISGDGARGGNGTAVFLPNGAGPGGSNAGIFQSENQVQISADGQRIGDNNFMVDGVSVNSLTHGGAAVVTPNQEAVSAITIVSTSYDASLARYSGAQIQVVTKSGTNQLHGSAFFLYDDPGLNSFNKYGGPAPNTPIVRNENSQRTWAASLGGPIVKNKLFLFASFEEYKDSNPTFANQYTLTPQYRAALIANRGGGISESIVAAPSSNPDIVAILTPNCTGLTVGVNCNVVTGGLDLGSFTPGGTTQLGVFPAANTGAGLDGVPDVEYAQIKVPGQSRGNQYNARVDYQLTQRDLIAGSVYISKLDNVGSTATSPSAFQSVVPFKPLNSTATLIYIHTFSPSWLNELRGNATRFTDNAINDGGNAVNYGIPYDNVQNYPFPIQFGVYASATTPSNFAENTYEVRDTATHVFGSHTIKFGVQLRFEQDNDDLFGYERPTYAFNGLFAFANDAAVYESIYADPNTGLPADTQRYYRSQDYAAFIQHDWKVSPSLTFNAGLRWEMFTPWHNKGFEVNQPVLGPGPTSQLSGMALTLHNNFWNPQHNNWGPKVGFAFTPAMFNNKIVLRGGYSLAYNDLDAALINTSVEDGPGVANFSLCCGGPPPAGATPGEAAAATAGVLYALGTSNSPASYPFNPVLKTGVNANGFPASYTFPGTTTSITPTAEVYGSAPNIKYPSSDLYSLEMQGDLGHSMTATVGYQGSSGRHFARFVNQNFLYNQTGSPATAAYFIQTDSVANYNAINLQLRRPMKNHIGYSIVYTYAKSLDQVSNGDGADGLANQTNPADNATEYGPSDYDMKHRIVATGLYQTPTLHTHSAIVNTLVSGFQINGTYTWHTGFPWTPVTSSLSTTPVGGQLAQNVVRPTAYYGGAGSSCSNNAFETGSNFSKGGPTYFQQTLPQSGVYSPGIGRNSFRGPCYQDVDVSVAKEFAHDFGTHHTLLRLQANMYNFFNQLQLQPIQFNSTPGSAINEPYFGYSAAADEGRVIELLGRLQF
jgi:hypothetical protein